MPRRVVYSSILFFVNPPSSAQEITTNHVLAQQVVIDGSQSDIEKNREFVAGKIVIGRKTIAESSLQNVGEILRREPAITIGKDGRIGLIGLPGYTQILIDGLPPSGKDPFELDLIQVEKIEIIKSATASTGPFGIAGTINIVRRTVAPARFSQLNLGSSSTSGRGGANLAWMSNQAIADTPLSFNLSLSASRTSKPGSSHYEQTMAGSGSEPILQGERNSKTTTDYVLGSGELLWKLTSNQKIRISPDLGQVKVFQDEHEKRLWTDGRMFDVQAKGKDVLSSYSLPLQWTWRTESDSQIELKLSMNHVASSNANSDASSTQIRDDRTFRVHNQKTERNNHFINFNYKTELPGGHELEAGANVTHHVSTTDYDDFIDGTIDSTLSMLGTGSAIEKQTYRFFAQDDFRLNKIWALNFGISAEQQEYHLEEAFTRNRASFRIWSPSMHLVKKISGDNNRQLRASVARTFQAPGTSQLIYRPRINPIAPCDINQRCVANSADTADGVGNPSLQPERALGLNFSYTHGLSANSELSAEYYVRDISEKVGSEISLENVFWSNTPRYISRPVNLGEAKVRGIDFNMRVRTSDFWKEAPRLDLVGNLGFATSALNNIPAPDNRLPGQTRWHAKLGVGYTPKALPLQLNLDANLLPGDWVRNNLSQRTYQSRKITLNANTIWKINSDLRLSLNLDNVLTKDAERIDDYAIETGTLRQVTRSENNRRIGLRLEVKMKN